MAPACHARAQRLSTHPRHIVMSPTSVTSATNATTSRISTRMHWQER
jgi:hypothetical protein